MQRIDTPNGSFSDGTPAAGYLDGTIVKAQWTNDVQEEVCSPIEFAGLVLNPNDRTQLLQAIQILSAPIVGLMRNAKMSVAVASASATFTADQIVVGTGTGGRHFRLPGFNKTINLATTGAGGMDTGAPPNSGYVALYGIYNPTTGASALLAKNATSAVQPEVYGGANMPAGYTASALVSVWPTNASGQLVPGNQRGREVARVGASILSTTTSSTAIGPVSLSIAGVVPPNAVSVRGQQLITFTSATGCAPSFSIAGDANYSAANLMYVSGSTSTGPNWGQNFNVPIATPQTIYYGIGNSAAISVTYAANVTGYTF